MCNRRATESRPRVGSHALARHHRGHLLSQLGRQFVEDAGLQLGGYRVRRMPQHRLNILHTAAGCVRESRGQVPGVVQPDRGQSDVEGMALEHVSQPVRMVGAAVRLREYPAACPPVPRRQLLRGLSLPPGLERRDRSLVEHDRRV
jgi:hypothetical protein